MTNVINTAPVYPLNSNHKFNEMQDDIKIVQTNFTTMELLSPKTQPLIIVPQICASSNEMNVFARLNAEADLRQERKKVYEM